VGVCYLVKTLLSRNSRQKDAMAQKRTEAPHKKEKNLSQGKRNCTPHILQNHSRFFGRICEVSMNYLILSQIYDVARGCVS
jgi:ATP/ADP translocase